MSEIVNKNDADWKPKTYAIGGVTGLFLGLLSAYLFARASEESENGPQKVKTLDIMRLSVALLALVRQVTALGASGKN